MRQLQRTLGYGMKTAWHLGHRIREMMNPDKSRPIGGEDKTSRLLGDGEPHSFLTWRTQDRQRLCERCTKRLLAVDPS